MIIDGHHPCQHLHQDDKDPSQSLNVSEEGHSVTKTKAPSKSPGSGRKEYVPRHRTGAYAVLMTLYREQAKDEYRGWVTKSYLQEAAQPLADESLSQAGNKSEHYTAWSSVGTLLKHELVSRWSNPHKYNITQKGIELAARILRVERGEEMSTSVGGSNDSNKRKRSDDSDTEEMRRKRLDKFNAVNVNLFANDEEEDEDFKRAIELSKAEADKSNVETSSCADFDLGDTFNMTDVGLGSTSTNNKDSAAPGPPSSSSENFVSAPGPSDNIPVCLQLQQRFNHQMSASVEQVNHHTPEFELRAGSYDVILCVDNTETVGGGAGGRKTLKEDTVRHLQRCGVAYDRRNLNIGDFLWIARERVAEVRGQFQQRQPCELVLPYIVERKRLDDLWQSVKDGRYEEQKFRLKGCGLTHLHYLIEDYPQKREFWGRAGGGGGLVTPEAIEQAIANTAVQEGFTVKKTDDQKGTIEYLTLITRLLRQKYLNKDLASCTFTDISDSLVGRRDTTLLTFQHFNESSKKTKDLSVGEVFAKMLLRMKGLSVEMAQAIVSQFPTPRDLLNAYNDCDSVPEKIKVITDLTYGMENKRKIPKSVAEALMKVWTFEIIS